MPSSGDVAELDHDSRHPFAIYTEMDQHMASFKKEYTVEKKNGNVDEHEADAISRALLQLLMKWAMQEGNIFVWCFALLMWNLIWLYQ
jgi:hypothetical protein